MPGFDGFPCEFHLKFHIFDVQFPCTADWDLQQSCVKGPEGFYYTDCETLLSEAKISLPFEECAIRIVRDDSMCTSLFFGSEIILFAFLLLNFLGYLPLE
jgi:hypothetical protein